MMPLTATTKQEKQGVKSRKSWWRQPPNYLKGRVEAGEVWPGVETVITGWGVVGLVSECVA